MSTRILLEVLTPERKVFSSEVTELQFPSEHKGTYGILPGHTPVMVGVGDGLVRFVKDGESSVLTVFGGFAEVGTDRVTLLARQSELKEQLDPAQVEAAIKDAQARLKVAQSPEELHQAQVDLNTAQTRLSALNA